MPPPFTLRFAPEYGCWPTWDQDTGDLLDPAALPLPAGLAERILRWDRAFQATFDDDYPPDSGFPDAATLAAWHAEGEAIVAALRDVFGPERVVYRPIF